MQKYLTSIKNIIPHFNLHLSLKYEGYFKNYMIKIHL